MEVRIAARFTLILGQEEKEILGEAVRPWRVLEGRVEKPAAPTPEIKSLIWLDRVLGNGSQELSPDRLEALRDAFAALAGVLLTEQGEWLERAETAPEDTSGGLVTSPQKSFEMLAATRGRQYQNVQRALDMVNGAIRKIIQRRSQISTPYDQPVPL